MGGGTVVFVVLPYDFLCLGKSPLLKKIANNFAHAQPYYKNKHRTKVQTKHVSSCYPKKKTCLKSCVLSSLISLVVCLVRGN